MTTQPQLELRSRLGASFVNSDYNKFTQGQRKDSNMGRMGDMRSICLTLDADMAYYQTSEPGKLENYTNAQLAIIETPYEQMAELHQQVKAVLDEKALVLPDELFAIVTVMWDMEKEPSLKLMKTVLLADEFFAMLDLAKKEHLAGGAQFKTLRASVIRILKGCFQALLESSREFKKQREGGLYGIEVS